MSCSSGWVGFFLVVSLPFISVFGLCSWLLYHPPTLFVRAGGLFFCFYKQLIQLQHDPAQSNLMLLSSQTTGIQLVDQDHQFHPNLRISDTTFPYLVFLVF